MNKTINILLFIIICSIPFITANNYYGDDNGLTLFVDSNANNKGYLPGDQCGNSTEFSCNNLGDAVEYFKTVAVVQDPTSSVWIYQLLNIKMASGTYEANENSANFYQFNVTISPINDNSGGVMFTGGSNANSSSSSPLFTITPPPGASQTLPESQITISGINFNGFSQSILKVNTNHTYTSFTFQGCSFNKFDSSNNLNYSMISINTQLLQQPNITTTFSMVNCSIEDANSGNNTLIMALNTVVYIVNSQGDFINTRIVFLIEYGGLHVNNAYFNYCTTQQGILFALDSSFTLETSSFHNNIANFTSAVATFGGSKLNSISFDCNQSEFINNTSPYGSLFLVGQYGVDYATVNISNNVFNGNTAIYTANIPISVSNSTFTNNNSGVEGSIINAETTIVQVTDCVVTQSTPSTSSSNGVLFYIAYSTAYITNVTFPDVSNVFTCQSSYLFFSKEPTNFNPSNSVLCVNCQASFSNTDQIICQTPPPTSTSSFIYVSSSTSAGTTTTGSSTILQISKFLIVFSILISIILINKV
ncbi:hypothetical protein ACTA71_007641 [Dictyostelium dimigraforme]